MVARPPLSGGINGSCMLANGWHVSRAMCNN